MEQTALRPKPMPGHTPAPGHRPHAVRRRGRRTRTVLGASVIALVLVLTGIGLGTVGAGVIGMSKLAELRQQEAAQAPPEGAANPPSEPGPDGKGNPDAKGSRSPDSKRNPDAGSDPESKSRAEPQGSHGESLGPAPAAIGVEAVDAAQGAGARLLGVHQPGPGHSAGLVRGDVVTEFGGEPVTSAHDLARAVVAAPPGEEIAIVVRHANGLRQELTVTPGVVI
ncbi:PDZ domain-containing protein [Streptomyces sp. KLOTTS4A1]|uniref:PDZ domain-containing protein n=1 Tax=Streptomyces sp. KLOTTS4A1 TaxID=3390996 RepID=UPI0039F51858